ncbi:MAG: hypothetical protein EA376_01935 [Phycisphaeraceae bacterium]|nr:MAG: hypothetical protein EA376_01935 [Phycisphaeraceae bacterium]
MKRQLVSDSAIYQVLQLMMAMPIHTRIYFMQCISWAYPNPQQIMTSREMFFDESEEWFPRTRLSLQTLTWRIVCRMA